MLRIQKDFDGRATTLRLSGRIEADSIGVIRSVMNDGCAANILDLAEVTVVDLVTVQFLILCENAGIELAHCPPYVREWIVRERAEAEQL